ncbi:hypothetical protein Sya03_47550 [Spirilliplanes yamanashiensis]|uniref:Uncharacterized protein n=2 Tax=Spirilliplanes yamanashiensis TaxID=42233 RepID=A0A8J3YBB2_9ACTN|nr:hypothetical protein Sya03_47550 [Spirilliplanes yamanashiensis]
MEDTRRAGLLASAGRTLLAASAAGLMTGGATGSMVPGLGTLVGAAVGLALGFAVGLLTVPALLAAGHRRPHLGPRAARAIVAACPIALLTLTAAGLLAASGAPDALTVYVTVTPLLLAGPAAWFAAPWCLAPWQEDLDTPRARRDLVLAVFAAPAVVACAVAFTVLNSGG